MRTLFNKLKIVIPDFTAEHRLAILDAHPKYQDTDDEDAIVGSEIPSCSSKGAAAPAPEENPPSPACAASVAVAKAPSLALTDASPRDAAATRLLALDGVPPEEEEDEVAEPEGPGCMLAAAPGPT